MKIAPFDETAFHQHHPRGTVSFNYLLMGGEPESLENYRYILGRQDADFHMPRRRHAFEQIRLPLVGDMNLGEQGILHEGEIGYFPEGQFYGPRTTHRVTRSRVSGCGWCYSSAALPAWACPRAVAVDLPHGGRRASGVSAGRSSFPAAL